MDTVFCLDTSGSMSGNRLSELQTAVVQCVELAKALDIGQRFGVVSFGGNTGLRHAISSDYSLIISTVKYLSADGGTPMTEGLLAALKELANASPIKIHGVII